MKETHYFSNDPDFPTKWVMASLFIAAFLGYLNETLLNVALAKIMLEFAVSKAQIQWLASGFFLVMGALTPLSASLMQWFKTRTITLLTLAIFLSGSLLCALAVNFPMLLAGRLIQALAAAFSVPLLMNTIMAIYPPEKRGFVMGLVTLVFTSAPAIGPTLSGLITDWFGWRFLFLFTVPFTLIAMVVIAKTLRIELTEISRPKIDMLSILLCVGGFGGLIYSTSQFSELSLTIFATLFAVSVGLVLAFIRRQLQLETPMLDLRIFKVAQFRYSAYLLMLAVSLFLGMELIIPLYSQQVLLFSGVVTGLIMMPASIAQALLAPVFGKWLDKKGAKVVILPNLLIAALSLITLWFFADLHTEALLLSVLFTLFAATISAAFVAETHGLNALKPEQSHHGTAIMSTINPLSGALGTAIFVSIATLSEGLSSQTEQALRQFDGFQSVFMFAIGLALMAFAISFKFNPKPAQASGQI